MKKRIFILFTALAVSIACMMATGFTTEKDSLRQIRIENEEIELPVENGEVSIYLKIDESGVGHFVSKEEYEQISCEQTVLTNETSPSPRISTIGLKLSLTNWVGQNADFGWFLSSSKPNLTWLTGHAYIKSTASPSLFYAYENMDPDEYLGGVSGANKYMGWFDLKDETVVRIGCENVYVTLIEEGVQSLSGFSQIVRK